MSLGLILSKQKLIKRNRISYRDKTVNHIISKGNKLAQKEYKTKYNWEGKVIHKELHKISKFDNAD